MIFDIKMDFTRKAHFVAGGHMTDPPDTITYSSVVSCDSVRIAFLLAALNDIDIRACDIGNAYLNVSPGKRYIQHMCLLGKRHIQQQDLNLVAKHKGKTSLLLGRSTD
jgi:hypothetical protein